MRIAGVDPDTKNITIAWFSDEPGDVGGHKVVTTPPMKKSLAEHRFLPLYKAFHDWLYLAQTEIPFDFAYVEKPMFTRNAAATIWQSAVMGMIRCTLDDQDIPHQLVDPGTWKKETIGNGSADKEAIAIWAQVNLRLPEIAGIRKGTNHRQCEWLHHIANDPCPRTRLWPVSRHTLEAGCLLRAQPT